MLHVKNKYYTRNVVICSIAVFVAVVSGILDAFTPAMGDDLNFWGYLGLHDYKCPNRQTVKFIVGHIFGCNGRVFDYVGPVVINLLPGLVASLLMGIMSGLFFAAILCAIRVPKSNHIAFICFVTLLVVLVTPWWDYLWLRVCQFNYNWGVVFCVFYVVCFFNPNKSDIPRWKLYLLFVLSVCAGAVHEQTAVAMCATFFVWSIIHKRYKTLSVKHRVMLWGLLVGAIFPFFAPSIWMRFMASTDGYHLPIIPLVLTTLPVYFILIIVLLVCAFFSKSRSFIKALLFGESGVYLALGGVAAIVAVVGGIPGRTGLFSECCALIVFAQMALRCRFRISKPFTAVLCVVSCAFIGVHYVVSIIEQQKLKGEYEKVVMDYIDSDDGIVFADYTHRYAGSWLVLNRVKGVPDDDDLWLKHCLNKVYKNKKIPLIVLPVDMREQLSVVRDSVSVKAVTVYASMPQNVSLTQDSLLVQDYWGECPRIITKFRYNNQQLWLASPWVSDPGDYVLPVIKTIQ